MKRLVIVSILIFCCNNACAETKVVVDYGEKCGTYIQQGSASYLLQCKSELNMKCNYGNCGCKHGYVYDKGHKMCRGGLGASCTPTSESDESFCMTNSTCRSWDTFRQEAPLQLMKLYGKVMKYSRLHACLCRDKYVETSFYWSASRECRLARTYGQTCSSNLTMVDLRCDIGLTCDTANKCACTNTTTMQYNKELRRCVTPLGLKCSSGGDLNPCGKNAICSGYLNHLRYMTQLVKNNDGEDYGANSRKDDNRCICSPGFSPNTAGECAGSYRVGCSTKSDCNTDRFLTCINGMCQCENGTAHEFSTADLTCKIRTTYSCSEKNGPKCIENSVCTNGHCTCMDGFSQTRDGQCLRSYTSKCSTTANSNMTSCNHFEGLACLEGTCQCFDDSLKWNSGLKMCVAKERKPCGQIRVAGNPSELTKDLLYPFATPTSRDIFYSVGCDLGMTCSSDPMDPNWHYCLKQKRMEQNFIKRHGVNEIFKILFFN